MVMTDTLTPPRQPSSAGTSGSVKPRLLTSKFGDGWKQQGPDGVNPLDRTQTLAWDPILKTERATIVAFLEAHVGVPFWYTLPNETVPRGWVWTSISRSHPDAKFETLTVELEERFIYDS
jgi:phage-related protein